MNFLLEGFVSELEALSPMSSIVKMAGAGDGKTVSRNKKPPVRKAAPKKARPVPKPTPRPSGPVERWMPKIPDSDRRRLFPPRDGIPEPRPLYAKR